MDTRGTWARLEDSKVLQGFKAMTVAQMPRTIESDATFSGGTVMTNFRQGVSRTAAEEFCDIVETYSDTAYNIALRMLHNTADAEDAVQEAFISAYRAFSKFNGQSKVTTWLYRIVVNACLMKIRKEKSRANYLTEIGYDDAVVYDWRNDPEKAAVNGELREVVESGLGWLSPGLRAPVVLRDVQGLTTEEGAAVLELSVAAFKSRLHRGRLLLRKRVEDYLVS